MRTSRIIMSAAVALAMSATLVAQSQATRGTPAAARPTAPPAQTKSTMNPRTADGHPDLQGFYDLATLTPLERPAMFGNNLTLTPQQAKRLEDQVANPRPNLILLDLNIPRVNGREVLRQIKTDDGLKQISVVVLSSSDREEDVSYAIDHGAAAYISKSAGFERLNQALSSVDVFAETLRAAAF